MLIRFEGRFMQHRPKDSFHLMESVRYRLLGNRRIEQVTLFGCYNTSH